ncbi:hypothetical protein SFB5_117G2 [Candidatus Arthromitus sp. SFB-5]|nr:hypothetical protein SFB5_117G2 [Candidatus Arthromitus sp. SFB-5]
MENGFLKEFIMISSFNTLAWLIVLILLFTLMLFLKKETYKLLKQNVYRYRFRNNFRIRNSICS